MLVSSSLSRPGSTLTKLSSRAGPQEKPLPAIVFGLCSVSRRQAAELSRAHALGSHFARTARAPHRRDAGPDGGYSGPAGGLPRPRRRGGTLGGKAAVDRVAVRSGRLRHAFSVAQGS